MAYFLPSEWSEQSAVLLTWPHEKTDWQPFLDDIVQVYVNLSKAITNYQLLVIACHDQSLKVQVIQLFNENNVNLDNVRWFIAPCDDTWARDHGPITLINAPAANKEHKVTEIKTCLLDFTFNAWGSKYSANLDNEINSHLLQQSFCVPTTHLKKELILEGGSIESDGRGTLLTTEKCLLNKNRNAHMTQQEIESSLLQSLGMQRVLWLKHGYLAGDDTDAHIDTLARFAPEGIVYVQCTDPNDPHVNELNKMEQELAAFVDINHQPYSLFPLPMPKQIFDNEGELLPATYANYLIINGAVLVPTYNDKQDHEALAVIAAAHPGRKVIGIDCRTVIKQFGSLHCLTMQIPANVIK